MKLRKQQERLEGLTLIILFLMVCVGGGLQTDQLTVGQAVLRIVVLSVVEILLFAKIDRLDRVVENQKLNLKTEDVEYGNFKSVS